MVPAAGEAPPGRRRHADSRVMGERPTGVPQLDQPNTKVKERPPFRGRLVRLRGNPTPHTAPASAPVGRHIAAMAGQPLGERAVPPRDANGEVVAVEKLQGPLWRGPRRCAKDLSYRGAEPQRLAARTSAHHDVMMICAKYVEVKAEEIRVDVEAMLRSVP
jgi:hypothetical protein